MKISYIRKSYLIIELLQSFSEKEWEGFEQYLNCSFFNADKKLSILLQLIKKNLNHFDSNTLLLKLIHEKLFGVQIKEKEDLTKRQKNNVQAKMSIMLKVAQEYLQILAIRGDKKVAIVLQLQQLLDRKQFRIFEQETKKWIKSNENLEENVDYFELQFNISRHKSNYASLKNKSNLSQQLQSIKYNLNMFYLINHLDYQLIEMSLSAISSVNQADNQGLSIIKPLLNLSPYSQHPLLKIYRFTIELFESGSESDFLKLIKILDKLGEKVPRESLVNFYYSIINFCSLKSFEGVNKYKKHQIDIYRVMDEKNLLLLENNQMQIGDLRNMVLQSCRIQEFDWAVHIVNKYYKYVAKNIRDDVKASNLGIIAFYQNQYQQAIDYLFPLQSINQAYDINRRTIMMKCYFELDKAYKETTHQLYRSFESYIKNNKVLTSKSKTSYKNFSRTLINLYRIKHGATKMKLANVKQKLETQKLNSNKSWLKEKIKELE